MSEHNKEVPSALTFTKISDLKYSDVNQSIYFYGFVYWSALDKTHCFVIVLPRGSYHCICRGRAAPNHNDKLNPIPCITKFVEILSCHTCSQKAMVSGVSQAASFSLWLSCLSLSLTRTFMMKLGVTQIIQNKLSISRYSTSSPLNSVLAKKSKCMCSKS